MISYWTALIRQTETLLIGICLLQIRCIFTGEKMSDMIPDSVKHWGWYYYFFMLWFVIFPYFMMRNNWPHYGIWSMLYDMDPWACWISLLITLGASTYLIYKKRNN